MSYSVGIALSISVPSAPLIQSHPRLHTVPPLVEADTVPAPTEPSAIAVPPTQALSDNMLTTLITPARYLPGSEFA